MRALLVVAFAFHSLSLRDDSMDGGGKTKFGTGVERAYLSFPLPLGDDCMDAGGRATPGAVAEG
jgi:hypothetical protein